MVEWFFLKPNCDGVIMLLVSTKFDSRLFFGFSRRQFAAFSPEFNTILLIASYFEENNHFPSHTYGLGMTTDQLYS
jgi:hypothetical protein